MAKIFLVDLENIGWNGLLGLHEFNLTGKDKIYIFYSINTPNCPPTVLDSITRTKAKVETILVEASCKNALDFQLACFLGTKIKGSKNEFFIVSKDKGYSVLKSFTLPTKVRLISSFSEVNDDFIVNKLTSITQIAKKKDTKKDEVANGNKVKNMNKYDIDELKLKVLKKIISNDKLKYTNYEAVAGSIVAQIVRSVDFEDFKRRTAKISNKSSYRKEIIEMCSEYIG